MNGDAGDEGRGKDAINIMLYQTLVLFNAKHKSEKRQKSSAPLSSRFLRHSKQNDPGKMSEKQVCS